ncbi:MAG: phosphomannomutase/phosphoglucomutase, partial [Gammaproteobacteria bacterium]
MAKDKAVKATTKKTKNNESSSKLQSVIATGTIFTLLVTVVSFGYLGLIERPLLDRSSVQLQAQTMADSQASLINHTLRQLRLRLSAFANAAELLTALENKDELTIQRHQTELDRAFPESISAKLMILGPLGIASFDKKLHQLRNNIELDILRAVSSGNDVQPEAYKVGDKWLFSLAESIKSPEKKFATGALLLTLDGEYIKSLLAQLDSNIGSSNLVQKFKNKENIIATTGPLASTTLKVSADISSSSWTVNFVPSAVLISRSSLNSTVFWALFGAVFLTLIAGAFFIKRALQKALNENLDILTTFKSKPSSFTLPGFGDANKKIKEKLKNSINSDS